MVPVIAARIKGSNRYGITECCKKRNTRSDAHEREQHYFATKRTLTLLFSIEDMEISTKVSLGKERINKFEAEETALYVMIKDTYERRLSRSILSARVPTGSG